MPRFYGDILAMPRRKTKQLYQALAISSLGLLFISVLILLLTNVDWNSAANILLGVILAGFALYSVIHFFRIARYQYRKIKQLEAIARIRTTSQMKHLTPTEFEHYVGAMYANFGYSAQVTKQSGDGGIDVILRNKEGVTAVQVKLYTGTIQRPEINKFVGACKNRYDKMIFVTSSDFSDGAIIEAREQGVRLINGGALEEMANQLSEDNPMKDTFSFKIYHRILAR